MPSPALYRMAAASTAAAGGSRGKKGVECPFLTANKAGGESRQGTAGLKDNVRNKL